MKFNLRRINSPVAVILTVLVLGGCAATNPSDPLVESIRTADSDSVTDADKARAASLIRVANSTARSGDISTAASLFRRAHEIDEMDPVPLIGLGNALSGLGAHEQAAEAYRRALDISSDDSDALHGLGNALIALDQPSAAIEQFEAALSSKKVASPRTYNGIGVAYDMMGDHASAQAFYQTGLKGTPRSMSLRNNLGLSMALAGQFKKAIKLLRSVAADRRAGRRNRLNLALVYGLSGNNTAAREVARIDLDEPAVRRNLAYYRTLRALNDPKATLNAVGAGGIAPKGFTGKLSIGG